MTTPLDHLVTLLSLVSPPPTEFALSNTVDGWVVQYQGRTDIAAALEHQ
jgi:hypothetical protein